MAFKNTFFQKLLKNLYLGRKLKDLPKGSLVFFPLTESINCGLSAILAYKRDETEDKIEEIVAEIKELSNERLYNRLKTASKKEIRDIFNEEELIVSLYENIEKLKEERVLAELCLNEKLKEDLKSSSLKMQKVISEFNKNFKNYQADFAGEEFLNTKKNFEKVKDIQWQLSRDILANIEKTLELGSSRSKLDKFEKFQVFHKTNTLLNSLDILEVRGRDSAGISLFFELDIKNMEFFQKLLIKEGLTEQLRERTNSRILKNQSISLTKQAEKSFIVFTYKVAAEIGSLGDNVSFLRRQIKNDTILNILSELERRHFSLAAHTRWASIGEVSIANCHPVDNQIEDFKTDSSNIIQVALNGDIDNYLELRQKYENRWGKIPLEISTDTKIIPLQIENYLKEGHRLEEAFRLAVSDFEGSHAIWMKSDLMPEKIFLAQRGSGQSVFVGIGKNDYIASSELYGLIESTESYIKMEGEKLFDTPEGKSQGQILILNEKAREPLKDIEAFYYNGSPFSIEEDSLRKTEITSRDIDRQDFPHYFLKEISEAPDSVNKTLEERFYLKDEKKNLFSVKLEEKAVPESIIKKITSKKIDKIFFIGQGTASIAAQAAAQLLEYYMADKSLQIKALKASELSGFFIDKQSSMEDCLVIAISQSGTTTDTNRSVDMVKELGASSIAIVNRRDSDLSFKTQGVLYTSSGRDIEMSVASTKAFYSQIIASALLSLYLTKKTRRRDEDFISDEIKELLTVSEKMRELFKERDKIKKGAEELATSRTYWATVGSGPNKNAADEIRIKLSELCYKTISSDYVEDKKHIDLSAEPLILVCAAGTRESVLKDIVKDTAIFHAHKAVPIVICTKGEERFKPFASQLIEVASLPEHLSPLLVTMAGHLWGYYAALAINEGSRFLFEQRSLISRIIKNFLSKNMNIYEILQEKEFREAMILFSSSFREAVSKGALGVLLDAREASDILLLSKYLSGRLAVADIKTDFNEIKSAKNILDLFFKKIGEAINLLARPIDAIKHQAKTVTVGTSRLSEEMEGLLFDALNEHGISISQLSSKNILVLNNLQAVISKVNGAFLYKIQGLNLLGEANESTSISVIKKTGSLEGLYSRTDTDSKLKGSKRIIVHEGNVFIGQGRKDGRRILVIPAFSSENKGPRQIEFLLSCEISFHASTPLFARIKALGPKLERIKNNINEHSIIWRNNFLDLFSTEELFGFTADKIVEEIIKRKENL